MYHGLVFYCHCRGRVCARARVRVRVSLCGCFVCLFCMPCVRCGCCFVLSFYVIYNRTIASIANVFYWLYPTLNKVYLILSFYNLRLQNTQQIRVSLPPFLALPSIASRFLRKYAFWLPTVSNIYIYIYTYIYIHCFLKALVRQELHGTGTISLGIKIICMNVMLHFRFHFTCFVPTPFLTCTSLQFSGGGVGGLGAGEGGAFDEIYPPTTPPTQTHTQHTHTQTTPTHTRCPLQQTICNYQKSGNWLELTHEPAGRYTTGPRLNIKTVLSTYGDFHVKDKKAVRTSYL